MSVGVHASAIVIGERGVLLRGPSGSGKSLLALTLIERVRRDGGHAALIADDRAWLENVNGRLIARGAAATAGLCERRGLGLVLAPHDHETVIRLLVDLETPPRMPEHRDLYGNLCGVTLPRLALDMAPGLDGAASAALASLACVSGASWGKNVTGETVFA